MTVRQPRWPVAASTMLLLTLAIPAALNLPVSRARAQAEPKAKPAEAKPAEAKPADAREDSRAADREAITALVASFVKAFQARDAQALAAHWTDDGEYENDSGVTVRGRDALVKGFGQFFAKTPELTAQIRPESLRFLGRDTAIGEGEVSVRKGPTLPLTNARYNSLLVREEGRWRLAKFSESSPSEPTIADLSWLIGEWKSSSGAGAEVQTTYAWSPTKKFIHVDFTVKEKGLALTGKQIIGIDPATRQFRSWTFGADGGVGEADWSRDGDHWVLEAAGTLADGRQLTETNILRRVTEDAFTWQSIDRLLDDEVFPDLPPVKVTRVKPPK